MHYIIGIIEPEKDKSFRASGYRMLNSLSKINRYGRQEIRQDIRLDIRLDIRQAYGQEDSVEQSLKPNINIIRTK